MSKAAESRMHVLQEAKQKSAPLGRARASTFRLGRTTQTSSDRDDDHGKGRRPCEKRKLASVHPSLGVTRTPLLSPARFFSRDGVVVEDRRPKLLRHEKGALGTPPAMVYEQPVSKAVVWLINLGAVRLEWEA